MAANQSLITFDFAAKKGDLTRNHDARPGPTGPFDEFKNKLREKKAWARSPTAKFDRVSPSRSFSWEGERPREPILWEWLRVILWPEPTSGFDGGSELLISPRGEFGGGGGG